MAQEIINKYLSIDQKYILKIGRINPLKSKAELYEILKWWKNLSSSNTIGNLKGKISSNEPLIYIHLSSNYYYLNADTKKAGVAEFLKNKDNLWTIIDNKKRARNKVTNRLDNNPIEGFYLYKVL